jgi:hypothetical protein
MEERLKDVIEELELENSSRINRGFQSTLNQPNLVSVSSANASGMESGNGFFKFTVNLPRPVLEAETLELLSANIPQCNPNIPDTACAFWYYRLNQYSGKVPTLNNLCCIRLLPSYYKKEFIDNPSNYGYNVTFNSYDDVSTQLALSGVNDLGYYNYLNINTPTEVQDSFRSQFCPRDVSVFYDSNINKFRMTGLNTDEPPAFEAWDNTTAYVVGDRVVSTLYLASGPFVSFVCIQDNTNQQPNWSSSYWVADNLPVMAEWVNTTTYGANRIVLYDGDFYISLQTTIGNQPDTSPTYWELFDITVTGYWNRYLIAGYDDPNVAIAQGRFFQPYDSYTLFEVDTVVEYQGQYYKALQQTFGTAPPNATYWELQSQTLVNGTSDGLSAVLQCDNSGGFFQPGDNVYIIDSSNVGFNTLHDYIVEDAYLVTATTTTSITIDAIPSMIGNTTKGLICLAYPKLMGLNAFSKQFDMNVPVKSIPIGIPAQPFNPEPKRILNSILGFTWNGIMTPSLLANIVPDAVNEIPTTTTALYNRLRPVPFYIVEPLGILGGTLGDAFSTPTYTAEGYCNLVYSSIISIYASIVAGSTLDSQENTNLLALGSMNCGNLGIAFINNFIGNPLSVNGTDIYNITIELRDEFGEPYILTNNAVATLVLKVKYKKDHKK